MTGGTLQFFIGGDDLNAAIQSVRTEVANLRSEIANDFLTLLSRVESTLAGQHQDLQQLTAAVIALRDEVGFLRSGIYEQVIEQIQAAQQQVEQSVGLIVPDTAPPAP